ncbi:MAG TPA: diphosphomevalonate decarboxylase [Polyangiaceae bacterium]|nr:diphosphomevalonate decarboxylase [Polyangiaceae bacterium]
MSRTASAVAHPNIALTKYWGKLEGMSRMPSVPSLSMTLDAMSTTTSVTFDDALPRDEIMLNGSVASEKEMRRASDLLDRVRSAAGIASKARVESANDFPTASGLASSASGFAALVVAAAKAAGLDWDPAQLSDQARRSSVSAARSIFGGFATLAAGETGRDVLPAEPIEGSIDWQVAISVVVTTLQQKDVGSTEGMAHTSATSPYYAAWVANAPRLFERARRAVLARDLEALGVVAEESAFAMHASAMAAAPALIYFNPVTLAAIERVRQLRQRGVQAYVTIDAGPHVKVLSHASDAPALATALREVPGVEKVLIATPGGPAVARIGDRP